MWRKVWLLVLLILCGLILVDGAPLLRGPAPDSSVWHWPYQLRPLNRWWLPVGMAAIFGGVLWAWLARKLPTWLGLLLLVICQIGMQLSLVYVDASRDFWGVGDVISAEIIDRSLSPTSNGYFWDATQINALPPILRDYPAQMPNFNSEHTRTHPPGFLIFNYQLIHFFADRAIAEPLAQLAYRLRCADLWLIGQSPNVAAALVVWAIVPILAAGVAVPIGYWVGRDPQGQGDVGEAHHARMTAALLATLPSLLLFTSASDQIYVPLTLLVCGGALRFERRGWRNALAVGLLMGLQSFLSVGNAVTAIVVGVLLLQMGFQRKMWLYGILIAVGSLAPWLLFWGIYGVPPWEIVEAGLGQHYELVTTKRAYGTWFVWNIIDLLIFAAPVVVVGALLTARSLADKSAGRGMQVFAGATLGLLLLLNISGSARGEVGRIWLFLFALLAIAAAPKLTKWGIVAPISMLLITLAVGLSWRMMQPVLVVTEPPAMPAWTGAVRDSAPIQLSSAVSLAETSVQVDEETLAVGLLWEAAGSADYPYTAFVHVIDATGQLVAQQDNWPVNGQWPPTCWRRGDEIIDTYQIDLTNLASGRYEIATGMYNAQTLDRLGTVPLGTFER